MTAGKSYFFILLFFLVSPFVFAQKSKIQLQKEKLENLEKIKETEKILAETGEKRENSMG